MSLTPKQIVNELDKYIIGQDKAKRAVAIALRNRYRRSKLSEADREEITPKNIIMKGPTGVGKTEIARRLAKLVKAPFIKVEATKYTEVGYVGRDVESMIRDLVECSIRLVREEKMKEVAVKAEGVAEKKIVDVLSDMKKSERGEMSKEVFDARLLEDLRAGKYNDPQIEIEVYQGTYDDVKEWLRTGQVDIAFLSSTCREEFNLTELFREPLLCIVPQDWPEPQDGVMTPALMNGQSFVVQCDATDAEMRQFLKKYKIGTERRCHVIDDQSNIAMVEAGLGISIMPQMLLRDCKAAVKIYPIEPEEYRVVGLAVQRPAAMAPAVEQMFHHIVEYCKEIEMQ